MNRNPLRSFPAIATLLAVLLVGLGLSSARSEAQCPPGNGVLGSPLHFDVGRNVHFVASGDFNADGLTDIAVTNGDVFNGGLGSRVNVLIGQGNRSYAPAVAYPAGRNAHGVVAADFNRDGILDLAVANKWSDEVSVLLGNGSGGHGNGTFGATVQYAVSNSPFDLVTADFDGDGILDLATCLNSAAGVAVLHGNGSGGIGNGTFAPPVVFSTQSVSAGLEAGDLNHDGAPDLVETEYSTGTVAVLLNTRTGSFAPAMHFAAGPQPFGTAIADLDEDGNPDLAVANSDNGGTAILLGTGSGQFPSRAMLNSGNVGSVVAADFDQDGILDLAVAVNHGDATGYVAVHRGQGAGAVGNGTFGPATAYSAGHDAYQLLAGDLDADGRVDLFVSDNDALGSHSVDVLSLLPGACIALPPDPRNSVLTDVRDVPNDQGGKVFLTWTASSLDVSGGPVNQYRVWRRIPSASLLAHGRGSAASLRTTTRAVRADGTTDIVYWEALATLPAQRMPGYGYTAATPSDSTRSGNPYSAFFVSALTSNIDVFYSSNVDSGYSVDNIRPNRPRNASSQMVSSGVTISWDASEAPDLGEYRVYRGVTSDFQPGEATRIATVTDPAYLDADATGTEFYKLSAVDAHENESEFAMLEPLGLAGVDHGRGASFALRGARPNPARDGRWTIDLSLANGGAARLELLDLSGRRIAIRDLRTAASGPQSVAFDVKERLAPGVYLVRLTQGARKSQLKAVVIQ